MACDGIGHLLLDTRAISVPLKRVPPRVIWLKTFIRYSDLAYPLTNALSGPNRAWLRWVRRVTIGCLRGRVVVVEQRSIALVTHELYEALFKQMPM
jgi:hypothetical protein